MLTQTSLAQPSVVTQIIDAGLLAPSGDNCQPFDFSWDGTTMEINFLPKRAEAFLDTKNCGSWIALGTVLTNMHIAAQELGYKLNLNLFPKDKQENVVATITLEAIQKLGHPLCPVLARRCTNRKAYSLTPLAADVRSELLSQSNAVPGTSLELVEQQAPKSLIAQLAAEFDSHLFRTRAIHDCFHRWIRWTPSEISETRDGLPIESLELNFFTRMALRLAASWKVARVMAGFGAGRMVVAQAKKLYSQSAAFGLLSVHGTDPEDFVQGGMVLQRLWLTATLKGLSFQPVTGMMFLDLKYRLDRISLSPEDIRSVEETRRKIQAVFPAFTENTPLMLFRLGKASQPTTRSLRKPFSLAVYSKPADIDRLT